MWLSTPVWYCILKFGQGPVWSLYIVFGLALLSQLGSTAIGIQTSEGVCLAVEKRITSPLMEPNSIEKIVEIDSHIGM